MQPPVVVTIYNTAAAGVKVVAFKEPPGSNRVVCTDELFAEATVELHLDPDAAFVIFAFKVHKPPCKQHSA